MQLPHLVENWIDGRSHSSVGGDSLPVIEPATGAEIARMTASGAADVALAQSAAARAFPAWAALPAAERAAMLHRLAG